MDDMMCKLYSSAQIRELESSAAQVLGSSYGLMQRAALACWQEINRRWPQGEIHVVCGSGNNGGDGYEIATLAREAGRAVQLWQVGHAPGRGDGALAVQKFQQQGGVAQAFHAAALQGATLAVDALFGIGLSRDVEGDARLAIQALQQVPFVLAVDVPSGLDADTGAVRGAVVRATVTVTFIGQKIGLLTGRGPDVAGEIVFAPLDVSPACHAQQEALAVLPTVDFLRDALPPRARTAHKGQHGHVLVIGGDYGMMGAALMAGQAALRAGAGWVSVATRPEHAVAICAIQPELMVHGIRQVADLLPLLARASVIAIGPGLGQSGWAQALMDAVLQSNTPCVVDADALNLLAQEPLRRDNWVLTPHPGEAARLLAKGTAAIQQNRLMAVRELQARYGGVAVLKGAGTLVAAGTGPLWLCPYGNPGMGVGGMGDVLTGLIAALLAQGLPLQRAAEVGVCVHATAGDLAAQDGERGLLPTDLLVEIRRDGEPVTVLNLADAEATEHLGATLARALPLHGVIFLLGNLGAGKSTLARGLLRALGVQGSIKSPTYTLIEPYSVQGGAVLHMDLYRLTSPLELANLGLEDYSPQDTLWLVEWPEKGGDQLPAADLVIELQPTATGRSAAFSGPLVQPLKAALQNQHE